MPPIVTQDVRVRSAWSLAAEATSGFDGGVSELVSGYTVVQHGVRAPRVAVVVPGGEDWRDWARLGLYGMSHVWGGSGFVLVPHLQGEVALALLDMLVAYDPDYIVNLAPTYGQLTRVLPGRLRVPAAENSSSSGTATVAVPAYLEDDVSNVQRLDPEGERARQRLVAACSPYSWRVDNGEPYQEPVHLTPLARTRRLTVLTDLDGVPSGACLHAAPSWAGSVGLAAGMRTGLMEPPRPAAASQDLATDRHGSPEPEADYAVLTWLLRPDRPETTLPLSAAWQPVATLGVDTRQLSPAFDRTELGLGWVTHGPTTRETLVVVGDTAADFALAMGWDRIYGTGVWLPEEWASSLASANAPVRRILDDMVARAVRRAGRLRVTSTSLDAGALGRVIDSLRVPLHPARANIGELDEDQQDKHAAAVIPGPVLWPRAGLRHLGIGDQYDERDPLPFQRAADGTVTMLAPPPAPLLRQPQIQATVGLDWEVDLRIPDGVMPHGRGLRGDALLAPDEDRYLTWMRASRGQISFQAQRYDLVLRGTAPASQLARPRVRSLGLLEWAKTVAAEASLAVDFSQAGNRVEILRQLLGSRESLADLMAGPMRAALRAFHATHRSTSASYPEGNGVVVAGEGYLSLANLHDRIGTALGVEELRDQVDALTSRRVLRRGHLLSCATCDRCTFYDVDRLAQTNTCPRCGSTNEMARPRWKGESEPTWYYDLHPVARDLLAQNGDVPLLLAHHLRGSASRYADLAEIEIIDGQEAAAECDLLALVDDLVVVAEAKVTGKLAGTKAETGRAIAKRVRLAHVLRADQIVLATNSAEWRAADLDQLNEAIGRASWPIRPPVVRVVSGLGSGRVADSGA